MTRHDDTVRLHHMLDHAAEAEPIINSHSSIINAMVFRP